MFPSREPGRPRGAWLEAARRRLISSVRADCRMQGVDQYSVFLQIDRSQPARRYCCFDASQIGWSRFPDCWILALSPLGLACPDDSAGERGPLNDARLNDALLDTAGQQLQEFVVQGGGGRSRLGEPGRLPECLCWSNRWLECLACLSVVGPDTESSGCWQSGPGLCLVTRGFPGRRRRLRLSHKRRQL